MKPISRYSIFPAMRTSRLPRNANILRTTDSFERNDRKAWKPKIMQANPAIIEISKIHINKYAPQYIFVPRRKATGRQTDIQKSQSGPFRSTNNTIFQIPIDFFGALASCWIVRIRKIWYAMNRSSPAPNRESIWSRMVGIWKYEAVTIKKRPIQNSVNPAIARYIPPLLRPSFGERSISEKARRIIGPGLSPQVNPRIIAVNISLVIIEVGGLMDVSRNASW